MMDQLLVYEVRGMPMVLRRKAPDRVWTARIKLPVQGKDFGRVERSTGEKDLDLAIKAAHRLYAEITGRIERRGEVSDAKTFAEVTEEFIADAAERYHARRITKSRFERDKIALKRHLLPSLGRIPIDQIRTSAAPRSDDARAAYEARDLEDYLNKRLMNEHRPAGADEVTFVRYGKRHSYARPATRPSPETLRRERQTFFAVMTFAKGRRYIRQEDIPAYPEIEGGGTRRGHFTREQMEHLQKVSIARILKTKNPLRRRRRFFCHMRMMWIYLTGCRPQEITHITLADIVQGPDVKGRESFKLRLNKNLKHKKHERIVVPLPGFDDIFMKAMFVEAGYGEDDYIFADPNRKVLVAPNKMFRRLLEEAALASGEIRIDPRNPYYSLRHTFITERLYEGMEIGRLARWCGTSAAMIERHYGHTRSDIEMTPNQQKPFNPILVPIPAEVWDGMLDFDPDFRFEDEENEADVPWPYDDAKGSVGTE